MNLCLPYLINMEKVIFNSTLLKSTDKTLGIDSLKGFPVSPDRTDEIIDTSEMHDYSLHHDEDGRLYRSKSLFVRHYEKAAELYKQDIPLIPDGSTDFEKEAICWDFFERCLMLKLPECNLELLKYLLEKDMDLYKELYRIMSDQLSTRSKHVDDLLTMRGKMGVAPIRKGGLILKIGRYVIEVDCYHNGYFKFPKGTIEEDDDDWVECALREFWEETGLKISRPVTLKVGKTVPKKYVKSIYRNYRYPPPYYENYLCAELSSDFVNKFPSILKFTEYFSGEVTTIRFVPFNTVHFRKNSFIPVEIEHTKTETRDTISSSSSSSSSSVSAEEDM